MYLKCCVKAKGQRVLGPNFQKSLWTGFVNVYSAVSPLGFNWASFQRSMERLVEMAHLLLAEPQSKVESETAALLGVKQGKGIRLQTVGRENKAIAS